MLIESIKREVQRLKMKYQTTDPYELCEILRIRVSRVSMGTHATSCKGFFLVNARCKAIYLNADLPESVQRIILAHELGHSCLHSGAELHTFHDFQIYDRINRLEYEANIFAAELLLDDEDTLATLRQVRDLYRCAGIMGVPAELLDFKLRILQQQGSRLAAPYIARSDFLKNV